jgi:hypothetical protein
MTFQKTKELLSLKTDDAIDEACRYLEGHGMRFCVDFGTHNACSLACLMMEREDVKDWDRRAVDELERMLKL